MHAERRATHACVHMPAPTLPCLQGSSHLNETTSPATRGGGGGRRGRGRGNNREANKTSKQANKQTNDRTNTHTNKQTRRRATKQTDGQTNQPTNRQTAKPTKKQASRTNKQRNRQTSNKTNKQTTKQTNNQPNKQTNRHRKQRGCTTGKASILVQTMLSIFATTPPMALRDLRGISKSLIKACFEINLTLLVDLSDSSLECSVPFWLANKCCRGTCGAEF